MPCAAMCRAADASQRVCRAPGPARSALQRRRRARQRRWIALRRSGPAAAGRPARRRLRPAASCCPATDARHSAYSRPASWWPTARRDRRVARAAAPPRHGCRSSVACMRPARTRRRTHIRPRVSSGSAASESSVAATARRRLKWNAPVAVRVDIGCYGRMPMIRKPHAVRARHAHVCIDVSARSRAACRAFATPIAANLASAPLCVVRGRHEPKIATVVLHACRNPRAAGQRLHQPSRFVTRTILSASSRTSTGLHR